jgi:hypothetical protein
MQRSFSFSLNFLTPTVQGSDVVFFGLMQYRKFGVTQRAATVVANLTN